MALTLSQAQGWRPDTVQAVAVGLKEKLGQLEATLDAAKTATNKAAGPSMGTSEEARFDFTDRATAHGRLKHEQITQLQEAVDEAGYGLIGAHGRLATAVEAATRDGMKIWNDGSVTGYDETKIEKHSKAIGQALADLEEADQEHGQKIDNIAQLIGDKTEQRETLGVIGHDKADDRKAEAGQPVDFEENIGPLKDSPDDPNSQPSARDLDHGGPESADGDKSRGRGNDPVAGTPSPDAKYRIGSPQRPDLKNKDDFEYGSKESDLNDEVEWAKWGAMSEGAEVLRPDLDDATDMYSHFRDNTGTAMRFDYEEAYREDDAVRANVNDKIAEAQRAAERLLEDSPHTSFSMTGDATAAGGYDQNGHPLGHYPSTEDWQKTIGAYHQWASADVRCDGDTVTMTVTVHAEDRYNFNRGGATDVASGLPDSANGRFEEIGWAKPFDTSGELTRTVTWRLGEAPGSTSVSGPDPARARDPDNEPNQPR